MRSTGQVPHRMPIDWNLSVSFMVQLGLWVFTEVKCHFHHIASRVHPVNMTSITVDLDQLTEGVLVRFLHHELSLSFHPHFPYCPLCEVTFCSLYLKKWGLCCTSLRTECLRKLFGILLRRIYVPSPPIYRLTPVWTHGYLVIILYLGLQ